VFTSSTAVIFAPVTNPTVLNETNWNTVSPEEVERLGRAAHPYHKYRVSKILAEKG
jgi:nucleoside-diphosphate-sugar epimerase